MKKLALIIAMALCLAACNDTSNTETNATNDSIVTGNHDNTIDTAGLHRDTTGPGDSVN
jgi:hypothetical protein